MCVSKERYIAFSTLDTRIRTCADSSVDPVLPAKSQRTLQLVQLSEINMHI